MRCSLPKFAVAAMIIFGIGSRQVKAQAVKVNHPMVVKPQLSTGTITLSANPSQITFKLVRAGPASSSSGISITTVASGLTLVSSASLYGYFTTTSALSDSNGDIIPASDVFGLCTTGTPTTYTAFTQTGPFNASSSALLVWRTSNLATLNSGRTDTLQLMIDLTSIPELPAGSYTGTLMLQVQAL